jgi:AhpD family alkylhydroperoxidase
MEEVMSTPDNDADGIRRHFVETMAMVPPSIETLLDMDLAVAQSYVGARELVYTSRDGGLSLAHKELLFVALALVTENVTGARAHLRAAKRAGLTEVELQELLTLAYFELGSNVWGAIGHALWQTWHESDAA